MRKFQTCYRLWLERCPVTAAAILTFWMSIDRPAMLPSIGIAESALDPKRSGVSVPTHELQGVTANLARDLVREAFGHRGLLRIPQSVTRSGCGLVDQQPTRPHLHRHARKMKLHGLEIGD